MGWFSRSRNWGMLVLGIWLILFGLAQPPVSLNFMHFQLILAAGAIAAGVLLLLGR